MKLFICVMCVSHLLPVQPKDTQRYTYCESCRAAAQEIEKAIKEVPPESRQKVVENLISGGVCKKLLSHQHDHVSMDKMTSSCIHLLDSHREQFRAALMKSEPKHLEIVMCYEQSTACVGVKRQSLKDSKTTFTQSDIDALIRDNKENIRITQPIHSSSPVQSRDEL